MHLGRTEHCLPEDNICWKWHTHNHVMCLIKVACTAKKVHNGAIVFHIGRNPHGIENPASIIDKPSMVATAQNSKVSYFVWLNPRWHFIKQLQCICSVPMGGKRLNCSIVGHKC